MSVSICIITYNHEKFIVQALESVLMQKVNFSREIIIADDCSTDNTRQICTGYQKKHPEIKLLFREKNVGYQRNWLSVITACTGKYFAILEGDDYWTDPLKLQKQYDYMEANPDAAFCYSNASSFEDESGILLGDVIKNKPVKQKFDLEFYINNGCFTIPTLTIFVRKDVFPAGFPDWLYDTFNLDWALHFFYLEKGKAGYIDENTSMYRIHKAGVLSSTALPYKIKNGILLMKNLDKFFDFKYHKVFGNTLWKYRDLSVFYFQKRQIHKGIYYFFYCFVRNPREVINLYYLKTIYRAIFHGVNA